MNNNHGGVIIEEKISGKDWMFDEPLLGGRMERKPIFKGLDKSKYLPKGEKQATKRFDPWNCTNSSLTNIVESYLIYLMETNPLVKPVLEKLDILDDDGEPNISERALAIMSGTIPRVGNTLTKSAETARTKGLVGEKVCPTTPNMGEKEYFTLPEGVEKKAEEFLEYFELFHEWLPRIPLRSYASNKALKEAIDYGFIQVTVDANYIKQPDGTLGRQGRILRDNHASVYYDQWTDHYHNMFDSYEPFKKKMMWAYKFGYPKVYYLKFKKKIMFYKEKGKPAIYQLGVDGMYYPVLQGSYYKKLFGKYNYESVDSLPKDKISDKGVKLESYLLGGLDSVSYS